MCKIMLSNTRSEPAPVFEALGVARGDVADFMRPNALRQRCVDIASAICQIAVAG